MIEKHDIHALAAYGMNFVNNNIRSYKSVEFFLELNKYLNIDVEQNAIKHSEIGTEGGISVRIYQKNGALGFAFTNILNFDAIERMTKTAFHMMKASSADPDFIDLPPKAKKYPNLSGIYDKSVENLTIENSLSYLDDLISECNQEKSAISQTASFSSNNSRTYIINSNDVEISGRETMYSLFSDVTLKDFKTGEISNGFEYQLARTIKEIDGQLIAKSAINNAKNNLNRVKIKSRKLPLVLSPRATIDLILRPLAAAINAETYQYKRSFLVDKLGDKIGSDLLTIEDNALIDGAVGSSSYDDEGFPCKNKKIIKSGTLLTTGLLHNSYTAGKAGMESSGNATRKSYSSLPSIGISNFIMNPGVEKIGSIIHDVKEGIFMYHTADSPNITTGDFSGLITQGNIIENGKIGRALNETMFGANLLDILLKITEISEDFKVYGPYYAPYVKIDDINIIGSVN